MTSRKIWFRVYFGYQNYARIPAYFISWRLYAQLSIWLRQWLGTERVTSQFRKKWWYISLMHERRHKGIRVKSFTDATNFSQALFALVLVCWKMYYTNAGRQWLQWHMDAIKNPVHSRYLAVTFLRGAPESSHSSPALAGYGHPLSIQILPRGRFMLNILLQSSATYRESIVVGSQHNSRYYFTRS